MVHRFDEELSRQLRPVAAPEELWNRIERRIDERPAAVVRGAAPRARLHVQVLGRGRILVLGQVRRAEVHSVEVDHAAALERAQAVVAMVADVSDRDRR